MELDKRRMKVLEELKGLFEKNFNLKLDICDKSILERPLLCEKTGISPGDLLLLLYDIEKTYKVYFSEKDILTGFRCLYDIVSVILRKSSVP